MSDSDGTTESLIVRALDPAHSVVVEACAGSGKTWLLASRIVRLLLAPLAALFITTLGHAQSPLKIGVTPGSLADSVGSAYEETGSGSSDSETA